MLLLELSLRGRRELLIVKSLEVAIILALLKAKTFAKMIGMRHDKCTPVAHANLISCPW